MIDVLLLGATGRTGTALLRHRPRNARLHLGVRIRGGTRPSSVPDGDDVRAIDLTDPVLMRAALSGIDVVVNAIRLPGEIPATALVDLHERIATARDERREEREGPLIIHVGGAGSLHLGDGRRFWQDPAFPAVTLPRGVAHAALRDHLESAGGSRGSSNWAYLIPPPGYVPEGRFTGAYRRLAPSDDERALLRSTISYEDFSLALADAIHEHWSGTHLISAGCTSMP